jgi:hypothetical protein
MEYEFRNESVTVRCATIHIASIMTIGRHGIALHCDEYALPLINLLH